MLASYPKYNRFDKARPKSPRSKWSDRLIKTHRTFKLILQQTAQHRHTTFRQQRPALQRLLQTCIDEAIRQINRE
jgi:hypothetical protein